MLSVVDEGVGATHVTLARSFLGAQGAQHSFELVVSQVVRRRGGFQHALTAIWDKREIGRK